MRKWKAAWATGYNPHNVLAWTRKPVDRYRAGAGLQQMKADLSSNTTPSALQLYYLYLSQSVHIGITGQGYKKLAEPAEMNLDGEKTMCCCAMPLQIISVEASKYIYHIDVPCDGLQYWHKKGKD